MPGPFPGMDPYLENPNSWQGTHNKLITHLEETLNAILRPQYHYDYLVCLNRSDRRNECQVWLSTVRVPLPRIAVPLDVGIPDVILDLQIVFDRFYDAGFYQRRLDYTEEPMPPLSQEDTIWADALLRAKGLR